jgi:hypothetical protein
MSSMRAKGRSLIAVAGLVVTVTMPGVAGQVRAQSAANGLPRTYDGKPDFNGIWQAFNMANWDLQDHSARQGPLPALGALLSIPAGQGIVENNEIPYRPDALAKKKENQANWLTLDPEVKCYLPGVPRAMYMPYPFQIVQTPAYILMAFQFASAERTIRMNFNTPAPTDSWMGWSRGKWEGDTVVVDVTGFVDQTWFDRAGNYHSDALHVVERYSLVDATHAQYEATIEDPKVFTRPWKISMPLYRNIDTKAQLPEYKCVEFTEELLYGPYSRK